MNNLNPTIELERQLGSQIYTALQGSVVEGGATQDEDKQQRCLLA
jgi:hypothetical protein